MDSSSKASAAYPTLPSAPYPDEGQSQQQPPPSYDQAVSPPKGPASYAPVPLQQTVYPVQTQPVHTIAQHFVVQPPVGPRSTNAICPSCQVPISTRVSHDTTTRTHLMALLCCLLCPCCFCVPYCMDSCKNTNHFCPNCSAFIGSYKDRI